MEDNDFNQDDKRKVKLFIQSQLRDNGAAFASSSETVVSGKLMVLPDEALNVLICYKCSQYLSVGSVVLYKMKANSRFLCGRCYQYDNGRNSNNVIRSLYNLVAPYCLFKCVNHFNGCRKMLYWNEAVVHDNFCPEKGDIGCLECAVRNKNFVQLVQHYKIAHSLKIIENQKLIFNIRKREKYKLLILPSDVFKFEFTVRNNSTLIIRALRLSAVLNSSILHYQLIFFNRGNAIVYVSEIKSISEQIEISFYSLRNMLHFERCIETKIIFSGSEITDVSLEPFLLEDSRNNTFSTVKDNLSNIFNFTKGYFEMCLTCNACGKTTEKLDWYFCDNHHFYCFSCCDEDECPNCTSQPYHLNEQGVFKILSTDHRDNLQVQRIFAPFKLKCNWPTCNEMYLPETILNHRKTCHSRQYQCPANNCKLTFILHHLKLHWHLDSPLRLTNSVHLPLKINYSFFWIPYKAQDVFKVCLQYFCEWNQVFIDIYEFDIIPLNNKYMFSIILNQQPYIGGNSWVHAGRRQSLVLTDIGLQDKVYVKIVNNIIAQDF